MQWIVHTWESLNESSEHFFQLLSFPLGKVKIFQQSGSYLHLMLLRQKSWSADSSGWLVLWGQTAVAPRALQCGELWSWALQVWPRCLWASLAAEQVPAVLPPAPGVTGVSWSLWEEQWQQEEQRAKSGWGCVYAPTLPNQWTMGCVLVNPTEQIPLIHQPAWPQISSDCYSCKTPAFCSFAPAFAVCPLQKSLVWGACLCVLQCWRGTDGNVHSPGPAPAAHPWPRVRGYFGPGVGHEVLQNVHGADRGRICSLQRCDNVVVPISDPSSACSCLMTVVPLEHWTKITMNQYN